MVGLVEGSEVLVRRQNANHLGVLVEIDEDNNSCLVRFPDCSESWHGADAVVAMDDDHDDDDDEDEENDVIKKTENGTVNGDCNGTINGTDNATFNGVSNGTINGTVNGRKRSRSSSLDPEERPAKLAKLPYDMNALVWNDDHTTNKQQCYCFCGFSGTWYKRMVQCESCLQWFHAKCIEAAIPGPVLMGDFFFSFQCFLCSAENKDVLRRLDITWVQALHVVLFHLTVNTKRKYHDLHSDVLSLLRRRLRSLKGPSNLLCMAKIKSEDGHEFVAKLLRDNLTLFSCAAEHKKSSNFWGLREKEPLRVWPSAVKKGQKDQIVGKRRSQQVVKQRRDDKTKVESQLTPKQSPPALKFTPPLPPSSRLSCKSNRRTRGRSKDISTSDELANRGRVANKGFIEFVDPFKCLGLRVSPSVPNVEVFLEDCKKAKGEQLRVLARRVTSHGVVQHMIEYE